MTEKKIGLVDSVKRKMILYVTYLVFLKRKRTDQPNFFMDNYSRLIVPLLTFEDMVVISDNYC